MISLDQLRPISYFLVICCVSRAFSLSEPEAAFDVFHDECAISDADRQACGRGHELLDEWGCKLRGCCFDTTPGPLPVRCFLAKRMLTAQCNVPYEEKDDCGYYGISEVECNMRGCCWKPSTLPNDADCFYTGRAKNIYLSDGDTGRLFILHDDEVGTVCDDGFGDTEAAVACREMGFTGGVMDYSGHYYDDYDYDEISGMPIWLDDVYCQGDESSIVDCDHNGWGNHNCGHYEDVYLICEGGTGTPEPTPEPTAPPTAPPTPGPVPDSLFLSYGDNGRLFIVHESAPGTICDDGFGDTEAGVACRQMGFTGGVIQLYQAYYDDYDYDDVQNMPIWLDDVNCQGDESSIANCEHNGWGNHNCGHGEDVYLQCEGGSGTTPPQTPQPPEPDNECGLTPIPPNIHGRIVGGTTAREHSWPFAVSFNYPGFGHFCGGQLISGSWVLTAGHCVEYFSSSGGEFTVMAGLHNQDEPDEFTQEMEVSAIYIHEGYGDHTSVALPANDIALVKLAGPVTFTDAVQSVCLPQDGQEFEEGTRCYAVGWGMMNEVEYDTALELQQVQIPVITNDVCNQDDWNGNIVTDTQICAGYEDEVKGGCMGDSGGPLVAEENGRWVLVGLTSGGRNACAREKKPGIYTRVSSYRDWVDSTMAAH